MAHQCARVVERCNTAQENGADLGELLLSSVKPTPATRSVGCQQIRVRDSSTVQTTLSHQH